MPLPWRVEMLGGLRVVQSDRTITRFQTQKTGALLAFLALNNTTSHSREVLAEMLWPGGDPIAVRNRLNQAVSSLRRQLEPANIVYGSVLVTDQRTIRIQPESIVTDVDEFQRFVQRAETTDSNQERKSCLKKAVDLYGGDFLLGIYADWAGLEQLRFADLYLNALYDLLDVARETGDIELAIRAATLLLKADPADEGTHCDLMRLYLDIGRPSAARRQFEELVRILASEETTPSEEALELNAEASTRRSASERRTTIASETPSSPESDSLEIPASGLPAPVNRFVGRESDINKLVAMLTEDSTRLVSIIGLGGCGKTRLALQTAHILYESFQKCVHFVSLADTKDPRQIEEVIAAAIGIRGSENIVRRLRQSDRFLLVLDNYEHLVDQGDHLIQSLLEAVPNLKILVTSRQPLRLDAERSYLLAPLPVPNATDVIEELIRNPSVALFVDRAQSVLPDFQLTPRNSDVVRQICLRLEGIPLAIELVATWAKTVAPGQMIALLSDRFALLESRRRDISARHRTMRAVIDSGVAMLPSDLQNFFFKLSVFQGGWTLEGAAHVCQTPQVLSAMEALGEQSLIQIENSEAESLRFRMLDTLRDYAEEHLPSASKADCENFHAAFYSRLAEDVADKMQRSDQGKWSTRLEAEYANFTAAFHWFLAHNLCESAIRLANSLTSFWEFKGRTREGRHWLELALSRVDESDPVNTTVSAEALNNLARMTWLHGDFAGAAQLHDRALSAWRSLDDSRGMIAAQFNIQMEAHRTRDYPLSLLLLEDNLSRAELLADKSIQSRCWLALGNTHIELHQLEQAWNQYEKSLSIAREIDNKYRIATALSNLGNLATLLDRYELAKHYLFEAVSRFEEIGARPSITDAFLHLAKMERRKGDFRSALKWLAKIWANAPEETYHIQALFLEQAFAASACSNYYLACVFLGFVERLREELGALNFDIESDEYDGLVNGIRVGLSIEDFESAWHLGRSLELAQAATRMLRDQPA